MKNKLFICLAVIIISIIAAYLVFLLIFNKTNYITDHDYLYDVATKYLKDNNNSKDLDKDDFNLFFSYDGFGITKDEKYTYAYMWILEESYYVDNGKLYMSEGSSIPYKFTFENDKVIKYDIPKDGDYYAQSIKELFPNEISKKVLNYDASNLNEELKNKVNEHYSYLDSTDVNY